MFGSYFIYKEFKIKRSSKIFFFKKLKDFIGIGGLHMPYKSYAFWRGDVIFHDVKKLRFIFLITRLFLTFVKKEIFFKEYTEMEFFHIIYKIFFIILEGFFEWQK